MNKLCTKCNIATADKYCFCPFCGKKLIPYDGKIKNETLYQKLDEINENINDKFEKQDRTQLRYSIYSFGYTYLIFGYTIWMSILVGLYIFDTPLITSILVVCIGFVLMILSNKIANYLYKRNKKEKK